MTEHSVSFHTATRLAKRDNNFEDFVSLFFGPASPSSRPTLTHP